MLYGRSQKTTKLTTEEYVAYDTKAPTTTSAALNVDEMQSCSDAFHQAITNEINKLGLSEEIKISQPLAQVTPPMLTLKGNKEAIENLQKSSSNFAHIALKI